MAPGRQGIHRQGRRRDALPLQRLSQTKPAPAGFVHLRPLRILFTERQYPRHHGNGVIQLTYTLSVKRCCRGRAEFDRKDHGQNNPSRQRLPKQRIGIQPSRSKMGIEVTSIEQKIERFISALETMGGSAGNQRLREALAWPETTYDSIKQQLLAEQRIVTGRGRGGSVAILESIEAMKARIINSLAVREVSAPYENKAVKEASPKTQPRATHRRRQEIRPLQLHLGLMR